MDALPAGFSEVDLESFFERLLPSVSKDSVSTIVALLHHNSEGGASRSHMQPNPPSIVRGRWRWYSKDPEDMAGAEDTVFAHFNDIYTVTTAATRKVLALEPRAVPCTLPQTSHKSKAGKKPRGHYVFDNIASWSFKKSDDDDTVKQNHEQLLQDVANLMFNDPARRFRFGITITNTSTRLWFLSRVQCFVSKPFNFITDHHTLVHFFASTTIASLEELGHDLTVRRVLIRQPVPQPDSPNEEESNTAQQVAYEYLVQDEDEGTWYQTVDKAIFSYQAARLLGQAVRVWKIRRVTYDKNGEKTLEGPVMVLKDYWIMKSSRTEADIFQRAKAARELRGEPPESIDDMKAHFMTIVHDVPVLLKGEEDTSERFICQPVPRDCDHERLQLPSQRQATEAHITSDNHTAGPASDHPRLPKEGGEAAKFILEARRHRRLVFAEVGVPLHELKDHRLLFQSLAEATKGLKVLHDAEYVHRDISTGNLLLCDIASGPICKISDLEYARPQVMPLKAGEAEHDHKTGTPFFMSIEVQMQAFANRMSVWGQQLPPFLHSYLHDLEGLWWIAIWSLFYAIPTARIHEVERNLKERLNQEMTAGCIFPVSLQGSLERQRFLLQKVYFDLTIQRIPAEFRGVIPAMRQAAQLLVTSYISVQSDATIHLINTPEPYTTIYGHVEQCFRNAIPHAAEDVRLVGDVRAKARQRIIKETERATLTLRAPKADWKSGGKRTVGDASADQPTSRPSKRAKQDDAPAVPVEDQDIVDVPRSPPVAVQQRAGCKKSGGCRLRERLALHAVL